MIPDLAIQSLHVPAPCLLHVHPPPLQSPMLHEPEALHCKVQLPPAHVTFAEPAPLFDTVQPPFGHETLHEPGPLQLI
jgi:hypothetical protein